MSTHNLRSEILRKKTLADSSEPSKPRIHLAHPFPPVTSTHPPFLCGADNETRVSGRHTGCLRKRNPAVIRLESLPPTSRRHPGALFISKTTSHWICWDQLSQQIQPISSPSGSRRLAQTFNDMLGPVIQFWHCMADRRSAREFRRKDKIRLNRGGRWIGGC